MRFAAVSDNFELEYILICLATVRSQVEALKWLVLSYSTLPYNQRWGDTSQSLPSSVASGYATQPSELVRSLNGDRSLSF